jgi:aspartyl-tRNA(Asn)/glutamyl-tRNA(Gln) amidotransferase subunit C
MSEISRDDVMKLAKLSRLALSEDEVAKYVGEVSTILTFVDQLSSINTDGVEPTYQVNYLHNVMRSDEIVDYGTTKESLMSNAPSTKDGMFKVRRMVG